MFTGRISGALAAVAAVAGLALPAAASDFSEVGDAGQTIATAQAVPAGTTSVSGTISGSFLDGATDVDLYRFGWAGGPFAATTLFSTGSLFDSQLFLFDAIGVGITANDDILLPDFPESFVFDVLAAGDYVLGISSYNADPDNFVDELPTGATLASWSDQGWGDGTYTIDFEAPTSALVAPVPEPGTVALMLLGLGLVAWKVRRRPAATRAA